MSLCPHCKEELCDGMCLSDQAWKEMMEKSPDLSFPAQPRVIGDVTTSKEIIKEIENLCKHALTRSRRFAGLNQGLPDQILEIINRKR